MTKVKCLRHPPPALAGFQLNSIYIDFRNFFSAWAAIPIKILPLSQKVVAQGHFTSYSACGSPTRILHTFDFAFNIRVCILSNCVSFLLRSGGERDETSYSCLESCCTTKSTIQHRTSSSSRSCFLSYLELLDYSTVNLGAWLLLIRGKETMN